MTDYKEFEAKIYVSGAPVACVQNCRVTEKRDLHPVGDFLSSIPSGIMCAGRYFEIELTRIEPYRSEISDIPELRRLDNFVLSVSCGAKTEIYTGCRFSEITSSYDSGGMIEKAKITALNFEEDLLE